MRRAAFLKRMAFAALACGFVDVPEVVVESEVGGVLLFKRETTYAPSPSDCVSYRLVTDFDFDIRWE